MLSNHRLRLMQIDPHTIKHSFLRLVMPIVVFVSPMHYRQIIDKEHIAWLLIEGQLHIRAIRHRFNTSKGVTLSIAEGLPGHFCRQLRQLNVEPSAHAPLVPGKHGYSRLLHFTEVFC